MRRLGVLFLLVFSAGYGGEDSPSQQAHRGPAAKDGAEPAESSADTTERLPTYQGKRASHWIGALKSDDKLMRWRAAFALGEIGASGEKEALALAAALQDPESEVSAEAAWSLGRLSPPLKGVEALSGALRDQREEVRRTAASALARLGSGASQASGALVALLGDRSGKVRSEAEEALVSIGSSAVPSLVAALPRDDRALSRRIFRVLGRLGREAQAAERHLLEAFEGQRDREAAAALAKLPSLSPATVKALAELLKLGDNDVTHFVRLALENREAGALPAVPVVIEALANRDARYVAQGLLVRIGSVAVPDVARALESEDGQIRAAAIEVLGEIGPSAAEAIPSLLRTLRGPHDRMDLVHRTWEAAARALVRIDPKGQQVLPAVLKDIEAADGETRRRAIRSLGDLDPVFASEVQVAAAIPLLLEAWREGDEAVARDAFRALGQLDAPPGPVLESLVAALKDRHPEIRARAARFLGTMGPQAAPDALPPVIAALEDDVRSVRVSATWAVLALASGDKKSSVPVLIEFLKAGTRRKGETCKKAMSVLVDLEPEAKQAVPALLEILAANDELSRLAAEVLGKLGAGMPVVGRALGEALDRGDWILKRASLRALKVLGPEARQALPAMIRVLACGDLSVEREVCEVFERLGPTASQAAPAVADLLQGSNYHRFSPAHRALKSMGKGARTAIPQLLRALDHPMARNVAGSVLAQLEETPVEAVGGLAKILENSSDHRRTEEVCSLLGRLGPPGREVLASALDDRQTDVRRRAAEVLKDQGTEGMRALVQALGSENKNAVSVASGTLASADAVPFLVEALSSTQERIRLEAAAVLARTAAELRGVDLRLWRRRSPHSSWAWPPGSASNTLPKELVEAVPALASKLRDGGVELRRAVAEVLGLMGAQARNAERALTEALEDEDPEVRLRALRALRAVGTESSQEAERIAALLEDDDAEVREEAASALLALGDKSRPALAKLVEAFRAPDGRGRRTRAIVGWTLACIGSDALRPVKEAWNGDDPRLRTAAGNVLGRMGAPGHLVLASALKEVNAHRRKLALAELARAEGLEKGIIAAVAGTLKDEDGHVRQLALGIVVRHERDERILRPVLLEAIDDADPKLRVTAVRALGSLDGGDAKLVSSLQRLLLEDEDVTVRAVAVPVLAKLGVEGRAAVPNLIRALTDTSTPVARASARALKDFTPLSGPELVELTSLLDRHVEEVNRFTKKRPRTLVAQGPLGTLLASHEFMGILAEILGASGAEAMPYLLRALERGPARLTQLASKALNTLDPAADAAVVERLTAVLGSPEANHTAQKIAAAILGRAGVESEAAVPALTQALRHWHPAVREQAASSLGSFGPAAEAAIPVLLRTLDDRVATVRRSAMRTLGRIGLRVSTVLPVATRWLPSEEDLNRPDRRARDFELQADWSAAVETLGNLGPGAKAAAPRLARLLARRPFSLSHMLSEALVKIGKDSAPSLVAELAKERPQRNYRLEGVLVRLGHAALPVLRESLASGDLRLQGCALGIVEQIGPAAVAAAPELVQILQGSPASRAGNAAWRGWVQRKQSPEERERVGLRGRAAKALRLIQADSPEAVLALIAVLEEDDLYLRKEAIQSLGAMGPRASGAVPKLRELAGAEQRDLRQSAEKALKSILGSE